MPATTGQGMRAVRVVIEGRVQGVGFRDWTMREARARGLSGWVRNRREGAVEAVFSGPAEKVRAMIESCRRGPAFAAVTGMTEAPHADPVDSGFRQMPTV